MKNLFYFALTLIIILQISSMSNTLETSNEWRPKIFRNIGKGIRRAGKKLQEKIKQKIEKAKINVATNINKANDIAKKVITGAKEILKKPTLKKSSLKKKGSKSRRYVMDPSFKLSTPIKGLKYSYLKNVKVADILISTRGSTKSDPARKRPKNRFLLDTVYIPYDLKSVDIKLGINRIGIRRLKTNNVNFGHKFLLKLNGIEIENFGGTGTQYEDIDFKWFQSGSTILKKGKYDIELEFLADTEELDSLFIVKPQNNAIVSVEGYY